VVSEPTCNYIQYVDSFLDLPDLGYTTVQLAKQSRYTVIVMYDP